MQKMDGKDAFSLENPAALREPRPLGAVRVEECLSLLVQEEPTRWATTASAARVPEGRSQKM